jgi:hypothetical protein
VAMEGAQASLAAPLDIQSIETEIAAGIVQQTGVTVTVQCPDSAVTGAASSFQCVAVDPTGIPTTVQVQVLDALGTWTWQVG